MATFSFPLQFLRQYASSLDADSIFDATSTRMAYLTSARRYAGQIVADTQDGNVYTLSNNTSAWNLLVSFASISALSASSTSLYNTVYANSASWSITTDNNKLPLSGGALTGSVTSTSTISSSNTITSNNLAAQSQIQYLSSGVVKVYQFYNTSTNSLDTVFN